MLSVEEELREELMPSPPLRPVQKMIQTEPAAAQDDSEQMPDFRYAERDLPLRSFYLLHPAPSTRPRPASIR